MWRTRRSRVVGALLGLGVLWIGLVAWQSSQLSGERLILSRAIVDLGEIPPNSMRSARVWAFNLTGQMVEVKVEASCGCAVPTLQKSALLPVDGMPIEVSVDTSGRSSGNYQQVVRLICRAADATWVEQILIRYTVGSSSTTDMRRDER